MIAIIDEFRLFIYYKYDIQRSFVYKYDGKKKLKKQALTK